MTSPTSRTRATAQPPHDAGHLAGGAAVWTRRSSGLPPAGLRAAAELCPNVLAAACGEDCVLRRDSRSVLQLVDHVAVGRHRQGRAVTELTRDVDDRAPLVQQQRGEAVAQ